MKSSQLRYRLPLPGTREPQAKRVTRALCGSALLLLLAWGSTAPASALTVDGTNSSSSSPYVINGAVIGPVLVNSGGFLYVEPSGSLTGADFALTVNGGTATVSGGTISGYSVGVEMLSGTLNLLGGTIGAGAGDVGYEAGVYVSGGTANLAGGTIRGINGLLAGGGTVDVAGSTISASSHGIDVQSGTVNISAGTVSGGFYGVDVTSGTATITGGSISGSIDGVAHFGGTLSITGCGLQLTGAGQLTGALQNGTAINTPTLGVTAGNLINLGGAPQIGCPASVVVQAPAGTCSASVNPGTAAATGSCSQSLPVVGTRSDGLALTAPYPVGVTTITWTATDGVNSSSCKQTVTVLNPQPPTITCPGNITALATSASGAVVTFTVNATDNCGVPTVVCTNQSNQVVTSGMTFPVGTTTVTCRATDAAGTQSSCSFTITVVVPSADLALTMSGPSRALTGTIVTYTIVARNNGPQPAQGVVLTDPVPAGTVYISAARSPSAGTLSVAGGTVTWNVGTLNPGQSITLTVVVRVTATAGAAISNTAHVSSRSPLDPNLANNTAIVATSVVPGG